MINKDELNRDMLKTKEGDSIIRYEDGQVVLECDFIVLRYGKERYKLRIIDSEINIKKIGDEKHG